MELSPGKQFFIDDYFIDSLDGARRVINQPQKLTVEEPLSIPFDRPWESQLAQPGRVIYDEQERRFRMYYRAWTGEQTLLCALDSSDGLNWERPELGLVEFDGSTRNNITNAHDQHLSLICDPYEQDDTHRWKQIDNQPTGVDDSGAPRWQAHFSNDGYNWHRYPEDRHSQQKMLFNFGSPAETFGGVIDPDAPYLHYSQRGSNRRTRVLGRRDSQDFLNWSGLRTVIEQDLLDPPGTEFYSAGFDPVSRTDGGLHILMLHTFQTDLSEPYGIADAERYWGGGESGSSALPARVDGFVETQLAVSRDTVSWTRYRQPFIPRGEADAWDWGMVYTDGPILHDNQLWFFYMAGNLTHNGFSASPGRGPTQRRIGAAKGSRACVRTAMSASRLNPMRPASSPPTVFARNRAARFGSMSMPAPVNCVMNCWRIPAGRFQAVLPPTATRFAPTRSTASSLGTVSRAGRLSARTECRSIRNWPNRSITPNSAFALRPAQNFTRSQSTRPM